MSVEAGDGGVGMFVYVCFLLKSLKIFWIISRVIK